jgi:hypothetical protein
MTLDLGTNGIEAVRGRGRCDRHQSAGRLGKSAKRRLGKADIFGTNERVVFGINVTRVVSKLGGEAAAIYPAGGATGQLLS